LWVSRTYIFAAESFPTNRRRVEVIDKKEVLLSPIQNALSTMINKNKELSEKIESAQTASAGPIDLNPLSMLLNGMIDAAVNGGTQKYIEAFMFPDFLQSNKDEASGRYQQALKQSLRDQIAMLKKGLFVFGGRSDPSLKGLYDHLTAFYDEMVKKTEKVLAS